MFFSIAKSGKSEYYHASEPLSCFRANIVFFTLESMFTLDVGFSYFRSERQKLFLPKARNGEVFGVFQAFVNISYEIKRIKTLSKAFVRMFDKVPIRLMP